MDVARLHQASLPIIAELTDAALPQEDGNTFIHLRNDVKIGDTRRCYCTGNINGQIEVEKYFSRNLNGNIVKFYIKFDDIRAGLK